jgi:hypothetical protein
MTKTVHQLRKEGHKVRVEHFRRYFDRTNGCYVYLTNYQYSLVNPMWVTGPLATGGYTNITLTTRSGSEYQADARCSTKENYCKKAGVALSLARIIKLICSKTPAGANSCA